MRVARTRAELEDELAGLRADRRPLALVPTMGYLHEGHLSLVDRAAALAPGVVATIFVNPLQFGPNEDLASYPRDERRDLDLLRARGAALTFVPSLDEMYPDGSPRVTVRPGPMGARLCGAHRPGHFEGVLTVVAKLFGLVRPEVAVFGRKDFQQAVLIRRMVRDLELRVRVETAPIAREADGLAMSSRNTYLGPAERAQAVGLFRALEAARVCFRAGARDAADVLRAAREALARHPLVRLQYLEAVDPATLEPVDALEPGTVVAIAAYCGATRLIDNVELG
ncbi:MAG TPA: pantoate--beta-alanine ligase [Longimicrobiales bacterium]|nr:pantoate--beta-alanine ligase [Longimicrobiales bacterium]